MVLSVPHVSSTSAFIIQSKDDQQLPRPAFFDDESGRDILQTEVDDDIDVMSDVSSNPLQASHILCKIVVIGQRELLKGLNVATFKEYNFLEGFSEEEVVQAVCSLTNRERQNIC